MNEEAIKLLYDDIKSNYDVGSLDDFKNYLLDDNNRQLFFDQVIKTEYDVNTIEDFESVYGLKKKEESQGTSQKVVTESITKEETTPTSLESLEKYYLQNDLDSLKTIEPETSSFETPMTMLARGVSRSKRNVNTDLKEKVLSDFNIQKALENDIITENQIDGALKGAKSDVEKLEQLAVKPQEEYIKLINEKNLDRPYAYEDKSTISYDVSDKLKRLEAIQTVQSFEAETKALIDANPNATEEELEAIFNREGAPTEEQYKLADEDYIPKDIEESDISNMYNVQELNNIKGFNIKDFDGYLNEQGYKEEYLRLLNNETIAEDNRSFDYSGFYNPSLAAERLKLQFLTNYINSQIQRSVEYQVLDYQSKNEGKHPSFDGAQVSFSSGLDDTALSNFIEKEFPLITTKLKERDVKNQELYKDLKKDDVRGSWRRAAGQAFKQGWRSLEDRINSFSAGAYDFIGMDSVADEIRMNQAETELDRGDFMVYTFASGKEKEIDGTTYLVDDKGQVYDKNINRRVTDVIPPNELEYIRKEVNEKGEKSSTFSTEGMIIQGSGIATDMLFQIALTRGVGNIGSGGAAFLGAFDRGTKAVKFMSKIPMKGTTASAMVAQGTLFGTSLSEETYKNALDNGLSIDQANEVRSIAGSQGFALGALTAPLSTQSYAMDKIFGKNANNVLVKGALEAYEKGGVKGARAYWTKALIKAKIYVKEGGKEFFQENVQQGGQAYVIGENVNEFAKKEIMANTISGDEFINISILSFAAGLFMPFAGDISSNVKTNIKKRYTPGVAAIDKINSLKILSKNVDKTKALLQNQVSRKLYTQEQVDKILEDVKIFRETVNNIPPNLSADTALTVMRDIAEIRKQEELKRQLDPAFHEDVDNKIKELREDIIKKTKFDYLSNKAKLKLKDDAIKELSKEAEERGEKDFVIDDSQATFRAIENFSKLTKTEQDAIQEQETDAERAEGVQEMEEGVREPSVEEKRQKIEQKRQEELELVRSAIAASEQTGEVPVVNGELVNKATLADINSKYDAELAALDTEQAVYLGDPTVTEVEDGQLYEFRTKDGIVAGVMTSPTEFRIDGISASEVGKGQGSKMFEGLINYLQSKGVKTISTQSAGEGAVRMHNKAVEKGLLTKVSEDGRNAVFTINEVSSKTQLTQITQENETRTKKEETETPKTEADTDTEQAVAEEESVKSPEVTVEDAPEGTFLNIEMVAGKDGREMTQKEILDALPLDPLNVEVIGKTLVIQVPRELSGAEMMKLAKDTQQDAIPQLSGKKGILHAQSQEQMDKYEGQFVPNLFIEPQKIIKDEKPKAGNRLFNEPLKAVKEIANRYYERVFGKERPKFEGTRKLDKEFAKRISDAFENMQNNPNDPDVKASYEAMAKETMDQYQDFIDAGYTVEINNEEPYANSQEMIDDLRKNKRIKIFSTESGFGDTPITDKQRNDNPLLRDSGVKDINGQTMLINDVFRAIHDFYGHAELGNSFGPKGEENAWQVHARMFSPLARRAMTTETRGQNSYVNFSGVNKKVDALREKARKLREQGKDAQKVVDEIYKLTRFADQKVGLLPEEFSNIDGIEKLRQIFGKRQFSDGTVNTLSDKLAIVKQANKAIKSLAKLFPDVKINVFYEERNYHQAIGVEDFSAGSYDGNNTININLTRATKTTVAHEVFHAILAKSLKSDKAIQNLTKKFVDSLLKTQDKRLIKLLQDAVGDIKQYENVQNEEVMSELFGVLAGYGKELKKDTRSLIKRFFDRLAKLFGLKKFTDSELVDVLNTLARKVQAGQEITDLGFMEQGDVEGVLTDRKQVSSRPSISEVMKAARENGISNSDTNAFLKELGYTQNEIATEIEKEEDIYVKKGNKVVDWLRKTKRYLLSAKGFLPKNVFIAKEKKDQLISAEISIAERTAKRLNKLLKNQSEEVLNEVNNLMNGKKFKLPREIALVAKQMREHIDSLSIKLVESGAVKSSESIENIKNNLGSYLNRSYRVFDDKNWASKVSEEVVQEAKQYLKKSWYSQESKLKMAEELSEKQGISLDEWINQKVDQEVNDIVKQKEANSFIVAATEGSKNLKVLKQRKEIPAEIRALMGEYNDPAYNYVVSVAKIINIVENQKFLEKIKDIGDGVFLFKEGEIRRGDDTRYVKVAAESNESLAPLNGYYMPKEIVEQLKSQDLITLKDSWFKKIYMGWLKAVGLVKKSKTIYSVGTHGKNVFGNARFMAQNGYLNPSDYNNAFKVLKNQFKGATDTELNELLDKYKKLGIINQSVNLNEIKSMFSGDDSFDIRIQKRMLEQTENKTYKNAKQKLKNIDKFLEDMYQAEDDLFKIVAYENEKRDYSDILYDKKYENLTDTEKQNVDDYVSNIVKNILPNYSRIGNLGKGLKFIPVTGTFISFQIEAYRTAYNTVGLAINEIKSDNAKMRTKGAKRLVALMAVEGLKQSLLYFLGASFLGDDDEEEKVSANDVRPFLPEWAKNSDIIVTSLGDGNFSYVNVSASDPYGGIFQILNAAARGEDMSESIAGALTEFGNPVLSQDIFLSALDDIVRNKTQYGGDLIEAGDDIFDKTGKWSERLWTAFEPGTLTSIRKIVKSKTFEDASYETIGQFTGLKPHTVDVKKILSFKLKDIKEDISEIKKEEYRAEYKVIDIGETGDLFEAYKNVDKKLEPVFEDANKTVRKAMRLGVSIYDIDNILTQKRFSNDDASMILFYDNLK